ncbi:NADH-ubiquinone oxidoreductase chain M [Bosea sp. BIWAKO-01]|nr:NADH-ubiquinone oxidoreductase chain M [Bosea sp. BIWAKO-01]
MHYSTLMLALSALAIVYGGLLALAQDDLKKLVAYSSISHMGFVTLGIFALNLHGLEGGILQMFNHGVTTGGLFLLVGLVYERTHTRSIADYGGLMKAAPVYTVILALFTLSSMALPGTNAFVGELLVLSGGFAASPAVSAAAVLGALLGAAYLLGMYRKVALGPPGAYAKFAISDVNARELAAILPLAILVLWVGFYPKPFLGIIDASVAHLLEQVHGRGGDHDCRCIVAVVDCEPARDRGDRRRLHSADCRATRAEGAGICPDLGFGRGGAGRRPGDPHARRRGAASLCRHVHR